MKQVTKQNVLLSALLLPLSYFFSDNVFAGAEDDPVLSKVLIDQLEVRDTGDHPIVLQGQAWVGQDLQKLWIKTEAQRTNSATNDVEVQALYSRAVSPYWDVQAGIRNDFKPLPERTWAVVGLQGLAPYFFNINSALFFGEGGRVALRFDAEYEQLITQKLILSPDIGVNVYGQNDAVIGVGAGLSDIKAGLRLRYEIRREFAPYFGVNWSKKYGNTGKMAQQAGEVVEDSQWVVGIRTWF